MGYYITYDAVTQFVPTTIHSFSAHNTPHDELIANDIALDTQLHDISDTVSNISTTISNGLGYIETIQVNQKSGTGSYPNITTSKGFTYTYTGSYIPISIQVLVCLLGAGSAVCRNQMRWLNSGGAAMTSFVDFVGGNAIGGGDGGAYLNWQFDCTVPFVVGAKSIEFQDLHYTNRAFWIVLSLTYQKLSRPIEWGY